MRVFYHCIDLTVVNAWILHKKVFEEQGRQQMTLLDFRTNLAESLTKKGSGIVVNTRGRPSLEQQLQAKKARRPPTVHVPTRDVRTDQLGHWPDFTNSRQRCRFPGCESKSFVKCSKCLVYLCLTKDKQCFVSFHIE